MVPTNEAPMLKPFMMSLLPPTLTGQGGLPTATQAQRSYVASLTNPLMAT
jgi:hypothetical protein